MLFSVFLSGAMISLAGAFLTQAEWTVQVMIGILMGTFSFAANSCMYKGFSVGKASIVAIFTGLPSVIVALLAYLLWGETLTVWQLAAFVVIVFGVLLIQYSGDMKLDSWQGLKWGLLTMIFFGLNDTTGKQAMLWEADVLPTLSFMFVTGSVLFYLRWLRTTKAAKVIRAKQVQAARQEIAVSGGEATTAGSGSENAQVPWPLPKVFLWGLAVGLTNVTGMILILPAFRLGMTGLVSAVVAVNVLLILFYTRITSKRKFTRQELFGIICAFGGIVLVRLFE